MLEATPAVTTPRTLPLGRDSVSWRVNGDPAPFLGASTALLLQVAHPSVAVGVAQHSDFKSDPYARLFRTLDTVLKVVFGTSQQVEQMRRRLAARHAPVKGVRPDGQPYDARDPDLGLWVWATLIHTGVLAYQLVHGDLRRDELEQFYEESKLFAEVSGVPIDRCPATWQDFLTYYDRVIEEDLERTPECLDVARTTFRVPSPRVLGPLGGLMNQYLAAALMPPRAREIYGLNWTPRRQRGFERFLRWYGPIARNLPRKLREVPAVLVIDHDLFEKLERSRQKRRVAAARAARAA